MNKRAGSKKFIKPVAAAGMVESSTTRMENIQNMPNRALGNLIAAATNAVFKNLSIAKIIPSETIKCIIPNTYYALKTKNPIKLEHHLNKDKL
jgi:hypothetical protein